MIHTYPAYKQRVGLLECGFSFTTGESLRVTCSEKRDRSSIFSDSIPNSQPPWMTQMSASRSSRWWGSFAKKLRKRPTRSPSLPKKYVPRFAPSNFPNSTFFFLILNFIVVLILLCEVFLYLFWCFVLVCAGIQHWEVAAGWGWEEEDQARVWEEREASRSPKEDVNLLKPS